MATTTLWSQPLWAAAPIFLAGAAMAYYFVIPTALHFLLSFQGDVGGVERVFELAPGEAYGERQPSLVVRLARAAVAQASPQSVDSLAIGDPLEILSPDGKRVVGQVKAVDGDSLTLDFNHPLAGQAMRFTVRLIGIL